jgi:hypothetical protein
MNLPKSGSKQWQVLMTMYVPGGPRSCRIPVLTSRWAYENWLRRRNNANFGTDAGRRAGVPRVPGSRIPVAADTATEATSFKSLERGSEYFCERRTMVSQPPRIPLHTSAGQNQQCMAYQCHVYTHSFAPNIGPRGSRIPMPTTGRSTRRAAVDCSECPYLY